jgi:hypothetical protein
MRCALFSLVLALLAATVLAQEQPPALSAPAASGSPAISAPAASASPEIAALPEPAKNLSEALDRLGALVKDGRLKVEADLMAGSVPAIPKYTLEVQGDPKTTIEADAADGRVTRLHFGVADGKLVVRGQGLRPKVAIESLDFENPKGITRMEFHGLGIWKPIVAIFGGIARSAVRKMEFRTDIPSVMKGEILGGKRGTPAASPPPGATPTPTPVPGGPPPTPPPSFMDLVKEVRIDEMEVTAYGGKPLALRPFVAFYTASQPESGEAMKVTLQKGVFRPGRDGGPAFVEFDGTLDGEIENGEMEFQANRCTIARGRIRGAAFQARTGEDAKLATALSAEDIFFELSSGNFVVPGGMGVALDSGSTFDVRSVKVTSDGHFSGVAKLDLAGKTGELTRKGATISASDITLKTPGLTVVDGRATGPLELAFRYQLEYPFVVKYPIDEIPEKKLMLDFHGPFATSLQLRDAGGDDGEVTGTYVFKAPWDPIEQAALAALEAKWQQDLAVKNIDFAIAPKMFRPCGESCFTMAIEVTAEKRSSKNPLKKLFSQFCAPVGSANLFVDKPNRSFVLKDVKIETHCKGVVGFVINFLTPFLTKTYSEMKLFQMPPNLPLTIDSVRGGVQLVEIAGTVDWEAGEPKPEVPPAPQPVVVEPEKPVK